MPINIVSKLIEHIQVPEAVPPVKTEEKGSKRKAGAELQIYDEPNITAKLEKLVAWSNDHLKGWKNSGLCLNLPFFS